MRTLAATLVLAWTSVARAGGAEPDALTAREVAHAGAGVVADAAGVALLRSPAALARVSALRLQLGAVALDDDLEHQPDAGGPPLHNLAGPATLPLLGGAYGLGRVVVGAVLLETSDYRAETPAPAFDQSPDEDIKALFPHRYAGTALSLRQRTLAVGAAVRALPWLALGASASASRLDQAEARRVWAGFDGITPVGEPARDLALALEGRDDFVPGATVGVLLVPEALPVEFAASLAWRGDAALRGRARLDPTRSTGDPSITRGDSAAALDLRAPLGVRAGLRYLGQRWSAELDLDASLGLGDDDAPAWRVDLQVAQPGVTGELAAAPSALARRDHIALRVALDAELVRDFVWIAAGYAYRTAATPAARANPVLSDSAAHTVGLGLEAYWNEVTVTVGYARVQQATREVTPESTRVQILNPFDGGTAAAGAGRYRRVSDQIGVSLEVAWDAAGG